jgi:hypothetical protein
MEIPDYEGLYYIEPNGDVYSQDRIITDGRFIEGQKMIPRLDKDGYYQVGLSKNGTQNFFKVHRLLALTYIPNPNNYPCINHIDRNRKNNNLNNLEWCTQMYNNQSINTSRNFGTINLTKWNTYCAQYSSNGKTYNKNFKTEKEAQDHLNQVKQKLINEKKNIY